MCLKMYHTIEYEIEKRLKGSAVGLQDEELHVL